MCIFVTHCIWATDQPNTNFRILIPRAFTWRCQIFTLTNATTDIKQNITLSRLFDLLEKIFAVKKLWFFFPLNIFIYVPALNHKETFQYQLQKQPPEHGFIWSFFSKFWSNYQCAEISAKITLSVFWIDISYILFWLEQCFQ